MAIDTTIIDPSEIAPTVEVRQGWDDAWSAAPYVFANRITDKIGNQMGGGTFEYDYGIMQQPGDIEFDIYDPAELLRWFVRVSFPSNSGPSPVSWYGLFTEEQVARDGRFTFPDLPNDGDMIDEIIPSGRQELVARPLTWLLQRKQLTTSKIEDGIGTKTINRALPFNSKAHGDQFWFGNRGGDPFPATTDDLFFAEQWGFGAYVWTAAEMLQYVLLNNPILDNSSNLVCELSPASLPILKWYEPSEVQIQGRTVWDAINQIIDRRRGLSWYFEVVEDTVSKLLIHVISTTDVPIVIGSHTIPANPTVETYDFDNLLDLQRVVEHSTTENSYEQLVIRGGRRGSVFSVSMADTTLAIDWTATDETAYRDAASGATGYGSASITEKIRANDQLRKGNLLAKVFTTFSIVNFVVGDAEGAGTIKEAFFALDAAGDADVATPVDVYAGGLRVEKTLPLRAGWDYSADPENPTTDGETNDSTYLRPFVVLNQGLAMFSEEGGTLWSFADRTSEFVVRAEDDVSFSTTVTVIPRNDAFGIIVKPNTIPHDMARDKWNSLLYPASMPDAEPSRWGRGTWDYELMIATIYVRHDDYVEAKYPATLLPAVNNQQSVRYIDIGDRGRLDFVLGETVLDIDENGQLIKAHIDGGFVRDDRPWMTAAVRAAWLWYSTSRTSLRIPLKQITTAFNLGTYLKTIGSGPTIKDVNTIITGISFDFQQQATLVETNYIELRDDVFVDAYETSAINRNRQ